MSVGFGSPRPAVPPSNQGQDLEARRRLAQAVGRAAERTRVAVSVDAHRCRLWLRNPRGTSPCPCTSSRLLSSGYGPGSGRVVFEPGEGDDESSPDSGYPQGRAPAPGLQLPADPPEGDSVEDDVSALLLGNGRRCGICWGTGWLDGHRLWGGERLVLCCSSTQGATLLDTSSADVDMDASTPTMLGPDAPLGGSPASSAVGGAFDASRFDGEFDTISSRVDARAAVVAWTVELPSCLSVVDALRVRSGLGPAEGSWALLATTANNPNPRDAASVMGLADGLPGARLTDDTRPVSLTLYLGTGARVSHVEIVLRSEPLINVQFPQLQVAASTELVAPYLVEEFELDPSVGYVERGSLIEVPPVPGGVGYVWLVSDVTVKRSAQGGIFGVVGTARSVQPTEIYACVSVDDSLATGLLDRGQATRGLEPTASGLPPVDAAGQADQSLEATRRSGLSVSGGGAAPARSPIIVLSAGAADE